jgi:hypothetical protein
MVLGITLPEVCTPGLQRLVELNLAIAAPWFER